MKSEKQVVVIGHKNPDTDSICSAISYAWIKNKITGGNYIAKRAGEISKETSFVLNHFGVPCPEYLKDIRTQVSDIDMRRVPGVSKEISIRQAYTEMKEQQVTTLCVTNEDRTLAGIITMTDIASSDMDVHDNCIVSRAKTSFANIAKTLDAKVLCGDINRVFDYGRVSIGANTPEMMVNYVSAGDIVILGNRFESQFFSIEVGASCIVLCTNSEPNPTILSLAKEKGCIILTSPYDSYTVARLINQSMPIEYFMTSQNLLSFETEDFTDEVKDVMAKERHRYFPVVDGQGKYLGLVSKRSFLALEKKQVILVDHNEKTQAVDGIESADIQEIIDHHRLGGIESVNPVLFRNQPVGCTATIIYQISRENNVTLTKQIAGLLCSAILSDTLMFRSPTCTPMDRAAAEALAEIAEIQIEEYSQAMFEAGSDLSSKSTKEIFYQDYKTFSANGMNFGVGQITSVSKSGLQQMVSKLNEFMENKYQKDPATQLFFMLTNIIDESTILLCCGDKTNELMKTAYHQEASKDGIEIPGMVSRKKQLVPDLISAIQQQ